MNIKTNPATDAIMGVVIGDAIGVPFEFNSREEMNQYPAKEMIGYGSHNQPPGTWSDDSSLTLCLAESLAKGYDLRDISIRFINWKNKAYWTARNEVFDIGMTTARSIAELENIVDTGNITKLKSLKNGAHESDNGNGSLMRIIPLLFYITGKGIEEQFEIVWEVSALTHKHIRAAMSCLIYLKLAEYLFKGKNKLEAYHLTRDEIKKFWVEYDFPIEEQVHFERVMQHEIQETSIDDLKTGGYVIEVLESAIWFFLRENSYEDTILGIINLGHDTDTSAAIAGGLAGLYYGLNQIPEYWITSIAKMEEIMDLGEKLNSKYN